MTLAAEILYPTEFLYPGEDGVVNIKAITQAVETLLNANLSGYQIERNPMRPDEPWKASTNTAWIGIYKNDNDYEGHAIGSLPWLANPSFIIEVQVASALSADDCEDRLLDAEKAVIDVINNNRNLSGTVDMIMGFNVKYEVNADVRTYYQAAIITVRAQVRTS
jgi:hypothetical protein